MLKKTLLVLCSLVFVLVSISLAQEFDIGGRIVYVSNRSGYDNLWILELDTSVTYPITEFPSSEGIVRILEPRWSPNGRKIAFIGNKGGTYGYELFIINEDGTGIKQLTDYSLSNNYTRYPCWNPNTADYVYYCKAWPATKTIVHRVNIETLDDVEIPNYRGSNTRLWDITSDGLEYLFGREISCCWTPSQYTGYQDLNSTYERIIKPSDGYAERIGRINREDNWIVYAESHGSSGAYPPDNIYKMDENGNFITQLTYGIGNEANRYPVWIKGNNSGYIIFESDHFGNYEIVMMKAEPDEYPTRLINLTIDPSSDRYPDWTPYGPSEKYSILFDDFNYSTVDELLGDAEWFTGIENETKNMYYYEGMRERIQVISEGCYHGILIFNVFQGDEPNYIENEEEIRTAPSIGTFNQFNKGIYAARIWFDDGPYTNTDNIVQRDKIVERFWIQTPKSWEKLENYAECDFEYLPNDFWSEKKPKEDRPPRMYRVTWEKNVGKKSERNVCDPEEIFLGGSWIDLIIKVDPENYVEYVIIHESNDTLYPYLMEEEDYAPEIVSPMQMLVGMRIYKKAKWSNYNMSVDWWIHIQDDISLEYEDIVNIVNEFRSDGKQRVDTTIKRFDNSDTR